MSILSDLREGKITFNQAATEIGQWASNLVAHDPTLTAASGTIVSDLKQAASDAIAVADTALGAILSPATKTLEGTLDASLIAATHGLATPFTPLVDSAISTMVNTFHAEIDAWALQARSKLAAGTPVNPTPPTH